MLRRLFGPCPIRESLRADNVSIYRTEPGTERVLCRIAAKAIPRGPDSLTGSFFTPHHEPMFRTFALSF